MTTTSQLQDVDRDDGVPPQTGRAARLRRLLAAGVASIGAAAVMLTAPGAHASVTNSTGTLTAGATCDTSHTVNAGAGITLDANRFPNGAWVAVRYEYWYVDVNDQPISEAYATDWQLQNTGPSTFVVNGISYVNFGRSLPGWTIPTGGRLKVGAQAAVWNGSQWEIGDWDVVSRYNNYGIYGIYTDDAVCLAG